MTNKICSFCGHRDIGSFEKNRVKKEMINLIENKSINLFYSGGIGEFDALCESLVRKLKQSYDLKLYLIAPALSQKINKYGKLYMGLYDDIIIPDLNNIHYKRKIVERNKWMAEQSDILLCYVIRNYGGAYQMYQYAKKINKTILMVE